MKYERVFRSPVDGRYYGANGSGDQDRNVFVAGGIIKPDDISDITAVSVLDEVLGLARPDYLLRNACRVVRMNSLTASIDVATKFTGEEKVPPLVEADIKAQSYTRISFDLPKNVVHVAAADESIKKASHDIMGLQIGDAARELARMENAQIADALEATTNTSGGSDWGGANNPFNDIGTAEDDLYANGHKADLIAAAPAVWRDFFSNDDVKGQLSGLQMPSGKIFDIPNLPGYKGLSDAELTNTLALVIATKSPGAVLGEGPTEAAKYRSETAGYDAYIIRQWVEPKIVNNDAIYKLTAVHA
jgi:hypothetical protein